MRREALRLVMFGALAFSAAWMGSACGEDQEFGNVPPPPSGSDCERNGADCPVLCDIGLGCVDCLTDSDCSAAEPACVAGECRECHSNSDCPTGQSCFPGSGECHDPCTNSD